MVPLRTARVGFATGAAAGIGLAGTPGCPIGMPGWAPPIGAPPITAAGIMPPNVKELSAQTGQPITSQPSRAMPAATAISAFVRTADPKHKPANAAMSREIGLPFCLAIRDFQNRDYKDCVEKLVPVRYMTHKLGGSFAQRDIIGWTLLEASLRAGRHNLALALANERCALKPTSPQNWRYVARAHAGIGDRDQEKRALARAESLMAA